MASSETNSVIGDNEGETEVKGDEIKDAEKSTEHISNNSERKINEGEGAEEKQTGSNPRISTENEDQQDAAIDEESRTKSKQKIEATPPAVVRSSASTAPIRLPPIQGAPSSVVGPSSTKMSMRQFLQSSRSNMPQRRSVNPDLRTSIFKTATKEREESRFAWATNFDFSMVSMACVIGLANFVRVPQLCKRHGGLAFFIPYLITVIFMGMPLYFLETLLGQYSGHGTVAVMNELVPAFVGIGYALVINNFLSFMRSEMDMARILFMLVNTMRNIIPWAVCEEKNDAGCYTQADDAYCQTLGSDYVYYNRSCTSIADICAQVVGMTSTGQNCSLKNGSSVRFDHVITRRTPEAEFYFRQVLNLEDASLAQLGAVHWPMFFCLGFCWLMTYLLGYNGFSTTAKSAYLTTFAPLLGQFALYAKAFCLTGAGGGIQAYLTFDWSALITTDVWIDSIKTCFSSLSLGLGLLTAISSASKPYKNCLKTSLAIICIDTLVSLVSGLGFFAVIGHLAHVSEVSVEELMDSETNILFDTMPRTLTSLNFPRLYVCLSYASTVLMSFGYLAAVIGMTTYDGKDIFNSLTNHHGDAEKTASNLSIYQYNIVTCILGFTASIIFVAKGGTLVLDVTDVRGHVDMSFVIAALQTIVICVFYGSGSVLDLVEEEMDMKLGGSRPYWALSWNIVAPFLLLWVAFNREDDSNNHLAGEDEADAWHMLGAIIAFYPFLVVLGFFIFQVYNFRKDGVWQALQPTRKWCLGLDTSLLIEAADAEPDKWRGDIELTIAPPSEAALPAASFVVTAPSGARVGPAPDAGQEPRPTIAPSGALLGLGPQQTTRKSIFEGPTAMAILDHTLKSQKYVPFQRQMEEGKRIRRLSGRPP
ncbi:sodium-dependent noradrenaline transporter-like [Amphibalanus amphitrite]|uniref:sodium-dependent noradrenaline transporter-like n=1 Tax=Amphibalanus amphitrite TaxID=1232801 RepID=UPI001C8FFD4E|nr:sodium-dependent noradrenaline transporter-like [Amphibalanus amphitrite]